MTALKGARTLISMIAVLLIGCGYLQSGRWEDDSENWSRAFGGSKPDSAEIIHSYCWRAPHFTYEGGYFFAIRDNGGFREELFSSNKLAVLTADQKAGARNAQFGDIPKWFAPKPADRYDVWVYADEPRGHFVLFIDRDDGMLFLADYQV